jgi:SpoVK/Ycf46/Vps4 family AAA+-type ATPase
MQFLASWDRLFNTVPWMKNMEDPWRPNAFHLYVQLNDNATFGAASERIKDAKMKRISAALQKKKPELFVHPMSEWYLKSEFVNGKQTGGRTTYVWLFGVVGAFVLLMACINFMNLSTARSEKRAKEVGIRRAIGSLRTQLINQFLSELDGVQSSNDGLLVLGATNAPWHLDTAFRRPGRFDRIIHFDPESRTGTPVAERSLS